MVIQIQEAVLHEISKARDQHGSGSVTVTKANDLLPVDAVLTKLCADLRELIDKANVGYGTLGDVSMFPAYLDQYLEGQLSLLEMSARAVDLLAHEMRRANFATGGYALFVRYAHTQKDFVLVAMLKIRPGAGVSEDLRLEETLTIDLTKLHEAARINLTRRSAGEQPYLVFAKGSRQGDVTAYFREALACSDYTDSKSQTRKAIEAAEAYVEQRSDLLDDAAKREERLAVRKRLVECFDTVGRGEVNPTLLATTVAPDAPEAFSDFLARDGNAETYGLNAPFVPHKDTYRKLRRISGTIGTVKLTFDVEDVTTGKVAYDADRDAVVLRQPGQDLKQAIREHAPD